MPGHFTRLRRLLNSSVIRHSLRQTLPYPLEVSPFLSNPRIPKPPGCDHGIRLFSAAGRTKSLIEDEAELSDWVSDIKKDSFRLGLSSDDDESDRGPPRSSRGRFVESGRDSGRGRDRGRGRGPPRSMKRLYSDSEEEEDDEEDRFSGRQSRGRGGRGRGGFSSTSMRRGANHSDSEGGEDEDGDRFSGRQSRGRGGRGRGGFSSTSMRRGENHSDSEWGEDEDRDRFSGRQIRGRGGRGRGGFSSTSIRRGEDHSDSEWGEDEDRDRFSGRQSRGRGGRGRGGFSSTSMRRGGGDFNSSYRQDGGGMGSLSKKPLYSDSEEGEDEDGDIFSSRQSRGRGRGRGGGGRRGVSSISTRGGGRGLDSSYRPSRGARTLSLAISEDEDETHEDDDDDDDDEEDDDSASGFENDLFGDKDGEQEEASKDGFESVNSPELTSAEPVPRSSVEANDSYLSQTRFDQCSISALSLKGIKAAGYERMTVVQEATLPIILKGKDVLAKAKTGTGKTVAFLLPAIEVVAKLPPVDRDQKRPPINVLVICPTRELAAQAAAEAEALLKFHPSIGAQVITGGTRLALEQKRIQTNPCQILVATPGRLRDHIENTPGFATRLMGVKVLVLDEADRLLDMGFRKDIEKIVAAVPKQRQTLLFSATVPEEVRQVCYIAMKRDHEFVNTVEEGSEETHSQVRQMQIVAPLEKHFSILYSVLTEHISEDADYKVIVFCTTAMVTRLIADLLSELKLNVREIHSRKPQSYRTRVSKEFKESKGLILVSSDVSARGVDYPNVTLVVQVGVPADREQYVHRLGRTGRKGKEGKGLLMLAPWEGFFLDSIINDLPVSKAPLPPIDPNTTKRVERALAHVEGRSKESAYQAWLGYYNSNKNVGRDKYKLVLLANEFSRSMGLDNPPAIPKLVLRKMGLNNVPGLRSK